MYGGRCWEFLGGSLVLANLGNDQGFIIKEYISIGTRHFGKYKAKP